MPKCHGLFGLRFSTDSFLPGRGMMMMMKILLRAGRNHGRWQEAATSERLGLSRLLNTCFYLDSRPELRNTEVTHIPR